ncbi:Eukaryotic translation initiation factor 4E-binding protein 3 [Sarcoptes scabiei]|nr:Eukaryotic translation initiation factor 4E-binding protein 3 [Sarcoptes scabiei]
MKETGAKPIPAFRRQFINDLNDLPDRYSSTPNGTLYSTTPGGTRIIYERKFLMDLKNSPLAKSPPKMAFIPGITNIDPALANTQFKDQKHHNHHHHHQHHHQKHRNNNNKNNKKDKQIGEKKLHSREDQPQFEMEI